MWSGEGSHWCTRGAVTSPPPSSSGAARSRRESHCSVVHRAAAQGHRGARFVSRERPATRPPAPERGGSGLLKCNKINARWLRLPGRTPGPRSGFTSAHLRPGRFNPAAAGWLEPAGDSRGLPPPAWLVYPATRRFHPKLLHWAQWVGSPRSPPLPRRGKQGRGFILFSQSRAPRRDPRHCWRSAAAARGRPVQELAKMSCADSPRLQRLRLGGRQLAR